MNCLRSQLGREGPAEVHSRVPALHVAPSDHLTLPSGATSTYSHITQPLKKNEMMPVAARLMDLEMRILNQRKTSIILYCSYTESETYTHEQNRNRFIDIENKLIATKRQELLVSRV